MKKKLLIPVAVMILLILVYLIGTGFAKTGTAFINDFSVADNGEQITLEVGNMASAGYIRKAAVHQQQGGKLYLDFYAAFGGINGSWGAKTSFTLPLAEDTQVIAVYRGRDCYEEVLQKDGNGVWQPV